ncbi:MAG: (Fe-S)-binding protein [Desulfarculaceae bacterium]|nr:(Fe-S)-binding protein [Desulfarculaceae bacterium]MCF8074462.1 (Fe-S)-binding protein [Desulfarculaceae bacterium]MCF8103696.1 (Fe-S)-binding protein [Desulfarculaceae bacterium]MCF8118132.1 (Fe-S)-binding protein [Desulfarculaceae bacterium]
MASNTRRVISQALSTLQRNTLSTGDPLGFNQVYWTDWAQGLGLPKGGSPCLYTGRMYQMLPYAGQAAKLANRYQGWLACPGMSQLMNLGNRLAGESTIRRMAGTGGEIAQRARRALRGIWAGLRAAGVGPGYLYDAEPYSGVLLHELGADPGARTQASRLAALFQSKGIGEVVAVDPHTVHFLRDDFPELLEGAGVKLSHYLELLAPAAERLAPKAELPMTEVVVHDSCVMARHLGIVEQTRSVAAALGLKVLEPPNHGQDTACCGGPIEYGFEDLCAEVSLLRARELAGVGSQVMVTCPICLLNLSRHESELGLRIWDLGELLDLALGGDKAAA